MSHRPLVFLPALTVGDYLLWNWSVGGNHDVLALIAGFSLLPLALASAWLIVLNLGRLIARTTQPAAVRPVHGRQPAQQRRRGRATVGEPTMDERTTSARPADRPSRKLAA